VQYAVDGAAGSFEVSDTMRDVILPFLAWSLCFFAAASFVWDAVDVWTTGGGHSVTQYIRARWLRWPAGIAIGLLVAAHFIRWPYR
jgi:hypothetical protein